MVVRGYIIIYTNPLTPPRPVYRERGPESKFTTARSGHGGGIVDRTVSRAPIAKAPTDSRPRIPRGSVDKRPEVVPIRQCGRESASLC